MPTCPNCKVVLGMCDFGIICPKCLWKPSPMILHGLPDYRFNEAFTQMRMFIDIMDMGLTGKGIYYLHLAKDGVVLELCGTLPD